MAIVLSRNFFRYISTSTTFKCLPTIGLTGKKVPPNSYPLRMGKPKILLDAPIGKIQYFEIKRQMSKGNHSSLWVAEKLISLAFVGLFPAVILWPHPVTDYSIAALLAFHHYVGIESVLVDYARPATVGKAMAAFCKYLNVAVTFIALFGLIQFSRSNILFGDALRLIWSLDNKYEKKEEGEGEDEQVDEE